MPAPCVSSEPNSLSESNSSSRKTCRPPECCPRQVVMELMPEEPLPGFVQFLLRIRAAALEPVGHDPDALGRVGALLILAVGLLHFRMRGVAAGAVGPHQQLPLVNRQAADVRRREIEEQLIRSRAEHIDQAVGGRHALLEPVHGRIVGEPPVSPVPEVAVINVEAGSGEAVVNARQGVGVSLARISPMVAT